MMKRAEVKQDLLRVPPELQELFKKEIISRTELLQIFRPVARARRRGFYDEGRSLLVCQEPREVLEIPREFVRFIED